MRCEPFLLFTHGIIRAQYLASRQVGSFKGGVSTASSSAIGSMYTMGARCSYEGRVFITEGTDGHAHAVQTKRINNSFCKTQLHVFILQICKSNIGHIPISYFPV